MDLKTVCRLCFKTDIRKEFTNMMDIPGLPEEISRLHNIEIAVDGVSTSICSDCRNITITLSAHVEMVKKTQEKIQILLKPSVVDKRSATTIQSNEANQSVVQPKNQSNAGEHSAHHLKEISSKEVSDEEKPKKGFKDGEEVLYYDIKQQEHLDAKIVRRVSYGEYAIRVGQNKRTLLRKAFFLQKKNEM